MLLLDLKMSFQGSDQILAFLTLGDRISDLL